MRHGLYLHFPFCTHRCAYCDFNTFAGLESLIPGYLIALGEEIDSVAAAAPSPGIRIDTVYFGGGTPSLAPPAEISRLLRAVAHGFDLDPDAEITLEANPGTVTEESLCALRSAGVNRLSLGVQSSDPRVLRTLERTHDYDQAVKAFRSAREAGFDNINLDLMMGVMGQSLESWQETLEVTLRLRPEHLSLYILTLEDGTPMAASVRQGVLAEPDADLAAEMYLTACEWAEAAGYTHYEISNWSRADGPVGDAQNGPHACRHNLGYWRNQPYLGLGAGAHGYAEEVRTSNVLAPQAYTRRMKAGADAGAFPSSLACDQRTAIDRETAMREAMLMGLRLLREGVSHSAFKAQFKAEPREIFGDVLAHWESEGLLRQDPERVRLTPTGWLLANQVLRDFV